MSCRLLLSVAIMIAFTFLLSTFCLRLWRDQPFQSSRFGSRAHDHNEPLTMTVNEQRNCRLLLSALGFSTLLIFIRSIYRTIELLNGWTGPIITNQRLFELLDGMMIISSVATFNFIHPGIFLPAAVMHPKAAIGTSRGDLEHIELEDDPSKTP